MPLQYKTFADLITFARPSAGYRFNSAGVLVPAAAGVPRIDYNPATLQPLGLMLEPQQTNLALWSRDFRDTAAAGSSRPWTLGLISITPNAVTSLWGGQDAQLLTVTAGAVASAYQQIACSASTQYTLSFDVKLGTLAAADFKFSIRDDTAGVFIANDIVPTQTPTAASWTRITYTFTTPVGCTLVRPYLFRNSNTAVSGTFAADNFQFEPGASTSSRVPTTTAQATRSADSAQITLPYSCDLLVQDRAGAEWRNSIGAGSYSLTPRTGFNYLSRVRAYPAGSIDSATKTAMAVAA